MDHNAKLRAKVNDLSDHLAQALTTLAQVRRMIGGEPEAPPAHQADHGEKKRLAVAAAQK